MADKAFPASLAKIQDSQYFSIELEDKGLKGEVEGGYTHTRPRHTRPPRRTFKTGFTEISQEQLQTLLDFYDLVGTYQKFNYTDPTSGKVYELRFDKPFSPKYKGIGKTKLWTITDIVLKQV